LTACALCFSASPSFAQTAPATRATPPAAAAKASATTPYRAPRTPDGRPNLSGIWQAMNEAEYDIQAHDARPGPLVVMGAWGGVAPSIGVVEGGPLPYRPEALAKKKENEANALALDPEVKCFLPGVPRATFIGFPFQIPQSAQYVEL